MPYVSRLQATGSVLGWSGQFMMAKRTCLDPKAGVSLEGQRCSIGEGHWQARLPDRRCQGHHGMEGRAVHGERVKHHDTWLTEEPWRASTKSSMGRP